MAALSIAALTPAASGARESPVVSAASYTAPPTGHGWGASHPRFIYNGGDASGSISRMHWSDWGGAVAHDHGLHPTLKPTDITERERNEDVLVEAAFEQDRLIDQLRSPRAEPLTVSPWPYADATSSAAGTSRGWRSSPRGWGRCTGSILTG